ncbi:predicted protein [Sclerotinia sclerotiorum 1980 UF-70]|uniref:Uncharacterized protein n=1 Tax=Sclerotinia sclerotiorum (strain ATCC 18683 / 1980 / Ss-1) TaxID=665079 RepID=A7E802_SCLS1|nr:predicted protein [Sclerotinia sclerotiorum 1980 UF-70]EDN96504.1 predicted protein [Sclerotinia sclerotiorum 1980 UF-70]
MQSSNSEERCESEGEYEFERGKGVSVYMSSRNERIVYLVHIYGLVSVDGDGDGEDER